MFDFSGLDIVTPALRQAAGEYMQHGQEVSWPLLTLRARERHLLTFLVFISLNQVTSLPEVTPAMVQAFGSFLASAGLHPGLIQSYLHSMAMFLRWCSNHPRLVIPESVFAVLMAAQSTKTPTGGSDDDA